jgi:hypothetical protein
MDAIKVKGSQPGVAKDAIVLIKKLFEVEAVAKAEKLNGENLLALWQEKSRTIIKEIESLWTAKIDSIPAKSLTGKALHYLKNQWSQLTRFLNDPRLPIHNNYLERQIRPFAVGRKAWLFSDTVDGANASATLYTLLNTAKENGLNPYAYLCSVLTGIASGSDLEQLLPFS